MNNFVKLCAIVMFAGVMTGIIYGQAKADPATREHVKFDDTFSGTTGVSGANNGVVLDDGTVASGRVLLDDGTWAFSTPFPVTGVIWVDLGNTTGTEDGSEQNPFDTIPEGLAASSVNNLIRIAGGPYAEALVIPHKLFFKAHRVTGLLSIDISSGAPDGLLGNVEYHSTGAIIHGGDDDIANGNLLLFVDIVAGTQTNPYAIGLLSATYDLGAQRIDYDLPGQSVISHYGIGVEPPTILSSTTAIVNFSGSQSFLNLRIDHTVPGTSTMSAKSGSVITGIFKDLYTNGKVFLSTNAAFNGEADNIDADGDVTLGGTGVTNTGQLTNIKTRDFVGTEVLGSTSTDFLVQVSQGGLRLTNSATFAGHASIADGASLQIQGATIDVTGKIYGERITLIAPITTTDMKLAVNGIDSTTVLFGETGTVQSGSIIEYSKAARLAEKEFALEAGAVFRSLGLSETGDGRAGATIDNKATFTNLDYTTVVSTSVGFAVSTGAEIYNSSFRGRLGLSGEFAPYIIGRDLLEKSGFGSGTYAYLAATNELVFHLASQPQRGDGAGSVEGIPTATTFTANMRIIEAGFSALKNNLYLFEVFEDVDTTPADGSSDTYGFSTTVGVSVWVLRSQDAQLDTDLGAPGSDITSTGAPNSAMIGIAATIIVDAQTTFQGVPFGSEITATGVSNGGGIYDASGSLTEPTTVTMGGNFLNFTGALGCNIDFTVDLSGATTGEISLTGGDGSNLTIGNSATLTAAGTSDITFNAGTVCGNGNLIVNAVNIDLTAGGALTISGAISATNLSGANTGDFAGDNFEIVVTDGSGALTTSPVVNQDITLTQPAGTGNITLTSGDGSQVVIGCSVNITTTSGDITFKNTDATSNIISIVGTTTNATHVGIHGPGGEKLMCVFGNGRVGFGTGCPNAPVCIRGDTPGNVGGFPSGALQLTNPSTAEFSNAVFTMHNSFNGNTQLLYFGSESSSNNNLTLLNRQNASFSFGTNSTARLKIESNGTVTIVNGLDAGNATSFEITNAAAPVVNSPGEIAVDNLIADFSNGLIRYFGATEEFGVVAMPISEFTSPTGCFAVIYNACNNEFNLAAQSMACPCFVQITDSTNQKPLTTCPTPITFNTNCAIRGISHSITVATEDIGFDCSGNYTVLSFPQAEKVSGCGGEFHSWMRVGSDDKGTTTSVSVANPSVITTTADHNLSTGQNVEISNTVTTPDINDQHIITVTGSTTFTIPVNVTSVTDGSGDFRRILDESDDVPNNNTVLKFGGCNTSGVVGLALTRDFTAGEKLNIMQSASGTGQGIGIVPFTPAGESPAPSSILTINKN